MDKSKTGFIAYLLFFIRFFVFVFLLFRSFGVGFFGVWFLLKTYLFSLQTNGRIALTTETILSISLWFGVAGSIFYGYICAFWMRHSFSGPPPNFKRKKKEELKKNI